jgi:hypothetical protein
MPETRIAHWPPARRLAAALFAGLILLFGLLAQANVWFHVGDGGFPGPERILWKYHGKPGQTKLHQVLDPTLPKENPRAMWPYLGSSAEQAQRRAEIFAWIDRGAPSDGWAAVAPVFRSEEGCAMCHSAQPGAVREDLPLDTYERVKPFTEPDRGISWGALHVTAHNHMFAFAVAALLLSVLLTFTGLRGLPRVALILAAFGGPVLDVGGWFLTKLYGAPWHFAVLVGGGLFGGAVATMAAVVAWEALLARPKDAAA